MLHHRRKRSEKKADLDLDDSLRIHSYRIGCTGGYLPVAQYQLLVPVVMRTLASRELEIRARPSQYPRRIQGTRGIFVS
eukprot:scaffold156390_cov54-Attheya_sp.AAC.2